MQFPSLLSNYRDVEIIFICNKMIERLEGNSTFDISITYIEISGNFNEQSATSAPCVSAKQGRFERAQ